MREIKIILTALIFAAIFLGLLAVAADQHHRRNCELMHPVERPGYCPQRYDRDISIHNANYEWDQKEYCWYE